MVKTMKQLLEKLKSDRTREYPAALRIFLEDFMRYRDKFLGDPSNDYYAEQMWKARTGVTGYLFALQDGGYITKEEQALITAHLDAPELPV